MELNIKIREPFSAETIGFHSKKKNHDFSENIYFKFDSDKKKSGL